MTSITRIRRVHDALDRYFWPALAAELQASWRAAGVGLRDAIVLLPQAGALAPARAAFAALGGWQPRIETVRTLASSLTPPATAAAGAPSLDRGNDRLQAAALLRRQAFGREWAARDPRAFDAAAAAVVDTAHALLGAAHARPPGDRAAWWQSARDALSPQAGPGASERLLARLALEWAADGAADPLAALWKLRPSAWTVVQGGGADPFNQRLTEHAASQGIACWCVDTDAEAAAPFDAGAALPAPAMFHVHDLEDEAHGAALAVLAALDAGQTPVALIAEDRLVVRRARALLERAAVALADETGWTLSTTRAAGRLMALLRAAAPEAGREALLDALKAELPDAADVIALESAWRRERQPDERSAALWQAARERFVALGGRGTRSLGAWLAALRDISPALMTALAADPAGRAVLAALRLDGADHGALWLALREATRFDLAAFTAWVADVLEDQSYVPVAAAAPQVVVLPLIHAVLRPLGAVVFPGCDASHLGASEPQPGLLPDALRRELGLPDAASRREHETMAFAQLLRQPHVTLLRRTHEGSEPLAPSPLVELALHARRRAGQSMPLDTPLALPTVEIERIALARPAPSMADALPAHLSASSAEALRECPYRFFARVALGLGEAIELDEAPDKRDHGRWLHAALHAYHEARRDHPLRDAAAERQRLLDIAAREHDALALDAAAMLPFRAAFETFADEYLAWLAGHEADGWTYAGGELARRIEPPDLGGVRLEGRLDRIDRHCSGQAMVIDYKSGSVDALKRKVRQPSEDTQLAFYTALLTEESHDIAPRAIYLVLDERKAPLALEHADPSASAALLIEGLGADLEALRHGQGAAALGEREACEFCEMRGLCRRDHWSEIDHPRSGVAAPPVARHGPLGGPGGTAGGPAEPDPRRSLGGGRRGLAARGDET